MRNCLTVTAWMRGGLGLAVLLTTIGCSYPSAQRSTLGQSPQFSFEEQETVSPALYSHNERYAPEYSVPRTLPPISQVTIFRLPF